MKMEYDSTYDQKDFQSRSGALDSQNSHASPGAYGYSEDSSKKLRKQWFQENDLDYYNSRNPSLNKQDSFESGYANQEYKEESNYYSQEAIDCRGFEKNGFDGVTPKASMNSGDKTAVDHERPYWLQDDESFRVSSDAPPNRNDTNKQNPDWLNQEKQRYSPLSREPTMTEKDNYAQEQNGSQVNPKLHRRFSSNPGLNLKTPFANDYVQEGAVMSENASAYSRNQAPKSSSSTQNIDSTSINKSNRLRSHRPQPSEMSKLLSFGYCRNQRESGDGRVFGRQQSFPTEVPVIRQESQCSNDGHHTGDGDLTAYGKQMSYKPTCIERAESGVQSQQEDSSPNMFRTSNTRERSSSFGKKKLSFDAGRPDFFNISNRPEGTEPTGKTPLDEGLFKMLTKDTRTNFRRRKMDINAPVLPGPLRPPMRR